MASSISSLPTPRPAPNTEELALLCEEMGISTGLDTEALIEAGRLAERIVGHRLPSAALRSGTLGAFRRRAA
jgi:hydroxymethylglutaryl-CoA lyase